MCNLRRSSGQQCEGYFPTAGAPALKPACWCFPTLVLLDRCAIRCGPPSASRTARPILEVSQAGSFAGPKRGQPRTWRFSSVNAIATRSGLAPEGATSPRQAAAADAPAHAASAAAPAASPAHAAASAASDAAASAASNGAASAASAGPNAAASSAASAAVSATAASTENSKFYGRPGVSEAVLVKEVERRQADVGDFFLIETRDLKPRPVLPERIDCRSEGRRRQGRRQHVRRRATGRRRQGHTRDPSAGSKRPCLDVSPSKHALLAAWQSSSPTFLQPNPARRYCIH